MQSDGLNSRIEWLLLRARVARNNGDHVMYAELTETAQQFKRLVKGYQAALANPDDWRKHLAGALIRIEDAATR